MIGNYRYMTSSKCIFKVFWPNLMKYNNMQILLDIEKFATEGNNNLQGTEINDKIFLYNLLKRP